MSRYVRTAGPPHGLGIDAVEQAWLSVPKPKHGSGLKHEAAVLHRLQMEHPAAVLAQEERMEGLTLMQVQLGQKLLSRSEWSQSEWSLPTHALGSDPKLHRVKLLLPP